MKNWKDKPNEKLYLCGLRVGHDKFYIKAEDFSSAKFGARIYGGYLLTGPLPDNFINIEPEDVNENDYPRPDQEELNNEI